MDVIIRLMRHEEYPLLETFLYQAIFVPEGAEKPPRSILQQEELQIYIRNFGTCKGDHCVVAEASGRIVGACWTRLMRDYGYVDDQTPSFAISVCEEFRGDGIGTGLMREMLILLRRAGYQQASLAVQKENYAVQMYRKLEFQTVKENGQEYIMTVQLS